MYFEIESQAPGTLLTSIAQGKWRWRLKAANHEIIAVGEGYANKRDCLHAIGLLKGTNASTPVRDLSVNSPNMLAAMGLRMFR
jgi:uncharacterized protein YegP (UPF0339 family)